MYLLPSPTRFIHPQQAINQFSSDSIQTIRADYLGVDRYIGIEYTPYDDKIHRVQHHQIRMFYGITDEELSQLEGRPGIRWNS